MKNNKTLSKILIILTIITVNLIAFAGIYVKDKNTTKNIVKENILGMNLKGYRFISLNPSTQTKEVYYDAQGNKLSSESEAYDESGNLKEGYKQETEKINKEEDLTQENFVKMKEIIENRLDKLGIVQYNIKLDKWTGQIIVELIEDSKTDEIISYLTGYNGQFSLIDSETKEVLITSNEVKDAKVMYAEQQTGTAVYMDIELNKKGKEKLKEVTKMYATPQEDTQNNEEQNNNEQTTEGEQNQTTEEQKNEKKVIMQVENQDVLTTTFDKQITNGVIPITMGTATTDEELSEYKEQAVITATMIASGETKLQYSVQDNNFVSPTVNKETIKFIVIATIIIIVIGAILWIAKYKVNGIYAVISYIGAIAIFNILLRYTNAVISLETIVAIYAILVANYAFINCLLEKIKNGQNIELSFKEAILEKLNIILPISVIAVAFTFMGWLPIFSIGMALFWGIITIISTNYLFTKNLIIEQDIK